MISPFDENSLQAGSYDVHLDDDIKIPQYPNIVNACQEVTYTDASKENYLMQPGQIILASTVEEVNIPDDVTGIVKGISSVGRLGLIIETAGVLDAGFKGHITLELVNMSGSVIDLTEFDRIGQLLFFDMNDEAEKPYRGKYQNQKEVTGSRYHKEYANGTEYTVEEYRDSSKDTKECSTVGE